MRKLRQLIAWTAVVGIAGGVTTAAAMADGRDGTESTTNDGGAWLLNRSEGSIGHVNRVVGEVESVAGPFAGSFDITQASGVVVVTDRTSGQAVLIDTTLSAPGAKLAISASTTMTALPDGVVAYDTATGDLWRLSRDSFGTLTTLDDVTPDVQLSPPGEIAVGLDGRIVAVNGNGTVANLADPDGVWSAIELTDPSATGPDADDSPGVAIAATVVGEKSIVLFDSGELTIIGPNGEISHEQVSSAATLQQPSVDGPTVVVVHDDGTMAAVDLATGDSTDVQGASSIDIRPIVHRGCVWSITTDPVVFHYCGRSAPLNALGPNIRLVLVNNWVWVNDVNTGGIWFVRDDDLEVNEISDWSAALLRNDQIEPEATDGGGEEEIVENADAAELIDVVDGLDDDGVNEPPVAVDDDDATRQGRPVVVHVLNNDSDPDHDPLSVTALSDVDATGLTANGARVTISADGSVVQVVPNVDFVGDIRFGYTISDGRGGEDSATVTVAVIEPDEATNRPPITVIDNATVRAGESVSLNVLNNDSDPDGDVLVLTGVSEVTGAIGYTPDGEVQFTPDAASPEGTVEIAYTVVDDYNAEATGTIRVRVRPTGSNQPPQARNDTARATVGRSVTLNVLTNDSDPDGDPLIAQNLQTADGTSTTAKLGPDGQFLFRPEEPGSYRFTYTVSDGPAVDVAQILLIVGPEVDNRPPVTVADEVALAIGETRLVRVLDNDGDPDGDVIGLVDWVGVDGLDITEVPGIGFYVTPTTSASTRSQFRYWISDGVNEPTMGTVVVSAIAREAVDYPPIAVVDTIDARAGSTTTVHVLRNDHDPEGRFLEIADPVATPPEARVRIAPDKQSLLLTVNKDQQFSFAFSYDVVDPAGNRGSAVVQVRIVPATQINRAPIAGPDVATTPFETPVTVHALLNDVDPDGDPIAIESISEQPAHGEVEIMPNGTLVYTPRDDFSGTDRFVYTLVDGYQPPLDDNGDPLVEGGPARDRGEVLIGVMAPATDNRPPIANDDASFAPIGISTDPVELNVLANDTDPDSDPLVVSSTTEASVGKVTISSNRRTVVYTPPAEGTPRPVSFSYTVADGRGGTGTAVVTLDLVEAPDPIPPVATDDSVGPVTARSVVTIDPRTNDIDADGDNTQLEVVVSDPALRVLPDGTLEITAPPSNQEFEYQVRDEQGLMSEPAIIAVIVTANQAPVITPIAVETPFNTPVTIDIAAAVTDVDQDPLVFTLGSKRTGGAAQTAGGDTGFTVQFTPDTDFEGEASFDFTVDDKNNHTITGTVQVTVLPPENREPTAIDTTITAEAGIDAIVRLPDLVTDPDGPEGHQFSVSGASGPISLKGPGGSGDVVISSDVADGGKTGSFEYTVVDGPYQLTKKVTVNLIVAKFAPPTLGDDSARTLQGQPTSAIAVLDNDVDNTPAGLSRGLTITNVGVSNAGTATLSGNSIVFTPNADFFGTATFTYTVQDARRAAEGESSATVSVSVIGRPAVPLAPSVKSVGDQYVVVSWSPPAGDASRAPVTGYILNYVGNDGTSGSITFNEPTTTHRWDGLTNGVNYCFTVAAVNEAGTGDQSVPGGPSSCGTPDIRPEAPSAPVVKFGDTELSVSWAEPLNRGSAIKNYQLRISGGTQALSAELGTAKSFVWKDLKNGTDYTLEVRAQNSAADNGGWSDWSALSAPEHPLTLPDAPAQPGAQRGDRQVVVSWQAPYDGGDSIQRYQVRSNLSANWVDAPAQGQANSYRWENIPNGTDVNFQVRAINRDGRSTNPGNISVSSPTVRTCSVPDAPAAPTATRGDTTASIKWAAPNDQGCSITQYRITASNGATQTASAGATSHVFTGLTNGTSYTFTVTAINEVVTVDGKAPKASAASNAVVPAGPPKATNVTGATNAGVRKVKITWSAPNNNGSPIIRYEISVNGGGWASVGNVTSVTRTEGSNGATYTYAVRAVNDVGAGPAGSKQTVTTWTTPGTPNVSASAGSRKITGSWTTPSNGGTGLTGLEAKLVGGSSSCGSGGTVRTGSSPETWSSLNEGTKYKVCVRFKNAVGWGSWGSATATTPKPQPKVTAYWGGSAQGQPGCTVSSCQYVAGTGTGFKPGETVTVTCWDNVNGGWGQLGVTATKKADSSGKVTYKSCYFGYPGKKAKLKMNGIDSNVLTN